METPLADSDDPIECENSIQPMDELDSVQIPLSVETKSHESGIIVTCLS
jgi:hypothetical protein